MAGNVIRLERNALAVDVSPLGGAILSAHWHGISILAPTRSPGLASQVLGAEACFPLVPFGNRIEGNSFRFGEMDYTLTSNTADPLILHGDGWLQRWTIARHEPDGIVFNCRHEASGASPFAYEATETISLDDDRLTLSLSVINRAAETLPYGLGFHPYFPRTPATRLFTQALRYWPERENHLPGTAGPIPDDLDFSTGAALPDRWLNNAFDGWNGQARIEWPETGIALSVTADEAFRHFVLYSPSASDNFFCFEPMSHRPNAHRDQDGGGLVALPSHAQLRGTMTLRPKRNGTYQTHSSADKRTPGDGHRC
ncbi:aldose 1-epimerase [Shinella sp. M27]|uniref:aldose 1-epimerase n=1 Tax=Shinella sp. M27 TaxID=3368614 RepID=UPI003BA01A86